MRLKLSEKIKGIFLNALVGSIIGGGIAGLIEGISKTLITGYNRWTLPITGIGYYGFLGLLAGIALGIIILSLLLMLPGKLKRRNVFGICSSTTTVYLSLSYFMTRISEILKLHANSLQSHIIFSLIGILAFWFFYFLYSYSYSLIDKRSKRVLLVFSLFYVFLLGSSAFLALESVNASKKMKEPEAEAVNSALINKPRVIFILIDALRYDWISPYGYDIDTPNMQTLADDGILFTNEIANSNWTRAAIASIFTSLLPMNHGVLRGTSKLPDKLPLLSEEMRQAGYYTVGFSTNPNIQALTGFARGFDEFYFYRGVEAIPVDPDAPYLRFHLETRTIIRNLIPPLKKRERTYCDAEKTTNYVMDWLRANKDKTFFMYLHYMDPHARYYHHPFNGVYANPANDPSGDNYNFYTSLYKGEIIYTDKYLGKLIKYLKDNGIYDSSLIIMTADHGEEMYDHYYWGHSTSLFEEQIHVPLIIKLPGNEGAGTINSSLLSEIDLAPMITKLVGIIPPKQWEGHNVFDSQFINNFVISQAQSRDCKINGIRFEDTKYIEADPCYSKVRINTRRLRASDKRAIFPENNLFDLEKDPHEKNNLFNKSEFKSLADSLQGLLHTTLAKLSKNETYEDSVSLDEKTISRLKELGYLQ